MYGIDFHADDYAVSMENSKRILTLAQEGRINSFSVIPNMGCFESCMDLLRNAWDRFPQKPLLSVHINLIDGFWLSVPEHGHLLRNSWFGFFFRSFIPGFSRRSLQAALSAEIEAQIQAFLKQTESLRDNQNNPLPLRIDSHVHTHMIPLVFNALMDVLDHRDLRKQVRFIRCSTEPLFMFLLTPGIIGTISPINLAKNLILNLLSHSVRKKLQRIKIDTGRIFGQAMTGETDLRRVQLLLPKMERYAREKDVYLEILSHPGRVLAEEIVPEYGPDDKKTFPSPKRDIEYHMLMELRRVNN